MAPPGSIGLIAVQISSEVALPDWPVQIAAAALWLASDDAASVNGQAITIDGGETIS